MYLRLRAAIVNNGGVGMHAAAEHNCMDCEENAVKRNK